MSKPTKNQILKFSPEQIESLTEAQIAHLIKPGKTFKETITYFLYLQKLQAEKANDESKDSGNKPGKQIVSPQPVPEKVKIEKKVEKTTITNKEIDIAGLNDLILFEKTVLNELELISPELMGKLNRIKVAKRKFKTFDKKK